MNIYDSLLGAVHSEYDVLMLIKKSERGEVSLVRHRDSGTRYIFRHFYGSSEVYRTLDEIKESGTINIGVFSDKNPFGYVDENGEYQDGSGSYALWYMDPESGEITGQKDLGVDVNFVSTEAANRIEYLQTGKVDIILANFTVTDERAEEVDFALPYMNVALGVVSPDSKVIESLDDWDSNDQMIVISGTTAETYLTQNYPDIPLQKFDSYATAKEAFQNGTSVAWANDSHQRK